MKRDIATFISTYGFQCCHIKNGVPIEVGAEERDHYIYPIRDNTGDNISRENKFYGELTGLYWIWKNVKNELYISFRHYNKYLTIKEKKAVRFLKSAKDGWIVTTARKIPAHQYIDEWRIFCRIIREKYPDYYPSLVKLYSTEDGSGSQCNIANMFITSFDQMAEYCKVLFGICRRLRDEIGDTDHKKSDQRYCAFMAERFLSIYIDANRLPKMEAELHYQGQLLMKTLRVAEHLGIDADNRIIKWLNKCFQNKCYKSSYDC